jgi:hypothetical protein
MENILGIMYLCEGFVGIFKPMFFENGQSLLSKHEKLLLQKKHSSQP